MPRRSVPLDTDPAVLDLLVDRWQTMTVAERVALVDQINADVELVALAGIRSESPELSEFAVRHELARRRYGVRLADEAYRHLGPE